ncbi:MAG: c-type cytochrome [Halocynthiibacter sp.]
MTLTKITGGLCGAFLIYLLLSWAGSALFSMGGGHGDHAQQAYVIDTGEGEAQAATEEAGPTFEELLASADVAKGEKVFGKCKACHKREDGANATGPHLFKIIDRAVASVDGFGYSGGMIELGGNWDAATLNAFLEKPKALVAGTKMSFSGLKKEKDRANLIAYLATIGN